MNPFEAFKGIKINGHFIDKATLKTLSIPTKEVDSVEEAIQFAKKLFDSSEFLGVQTSGSTGEPKEVVYPKLAFIQSSKATNTFFGLNNKSSAFLSLPMNYIAAKMMICRAIVGQYNLEIVKPSTSPLYQGVKFDFAPFTPHQITILLRTQSKLIPSNSSILIGGGAVSPALTKKLQGIEANFFASFGMTETLSHFAIADLKKKDCSFSLLSDSEFRIGIDGRLSVKRDGITDGWIKTNDRISETTNGFKWLGRIDNVINSGGIKIHPEQVEEQLAEIMQDPYFISGIPDNILGEKLVLFIEGNSAPNIDNFQFQNKHEKPKEIIVLNKFSYTDSGKIKRKLTVKKWLGIN